MRGPRLSYLRTISRRDTGGLQTLRPPNPLLRRWEMTDQAAHGLEQPAVVTPVEKQGRRQSVEDRTSSEDAAEPVVVARAPVPSVRPSNVDRKDKEPERDLDSKTNAGELPRNDRSLVPRRDALPTKPVVSRDEWKGESQAKIADTPSVTSSATVATVESRREATTSEAMVAPEVKPDRSNPSQASFLQAPLRTAPLALEVSSKPAEIASPQQIAALNRSPGNAVSQTAVEPISNPEPSAIPKGESRAGELVVRPLRPAKQLPERGRTSVEPRRLNLPPVTRKEPVEQSPVVNIGSIDIRILPAPVNAARPVRSAAPAKTSNTLSRGFTSAFGIKQG